ncbi:hypothetical protein HK102_011763 [Quaeritorhiza haematococci]|nr:hypothetical protein HK102_011763 [Quaeritorhiza haematococci]
MVKLTITPAFLFLLTLLASTSVTPTSALPHLSPRSSSSELATTHSESSAPQQPAAPTEPPTAATSEEPQVHTLENTLEAPEDSEDEQGLIRDVDPKLASHGAMVGSGRPRQGRPRGLLEIIFGPKP